MIIVESIALSIMISNHLVMPIVLRATASEATRDSQEVRRLVLNARRFSIVLIIFLGFLYFYLTRSWTRWRERVHGHGRRGDPARGRAGA